MDKELKRINEDMKKIKDVPPSERSSYGNAINKRMVEYKAKNKNRM